jgi:hypothetical protein
MEAGDSGVIGEAVDCAGFPGVDVSGGEERAATVSGETGEKGATAVELECVSRTGC